VIDAESIETLCDQVSAGVCSDATPSERHAAWAALTKVHSWLEVAADVVSVAKLVEEGTAPPSELFNTIARLRTP